MLEFRALRAAAFILTLAALGGWVLPGLADAASARPDQSDLRGPSAFALRDGRAQPPETGWLAVPDALEEYIVEVDPDFIAADPATVRIDLPYGPELEALRSHFQDYGPEWKSWSGTLRHHVRALLLGPASVCKRIDHFSDPTAKYLGTYATGDSGHNNAQMARSRLGSYPFFKPQKVISPPVASFTRSCNSATRKCTFDASGTTDNGTVTRYYWNFGDGTSTTTTSAVVSHTYGGSGTFYWVHLLATDNDNQRDLAIDSVTF